MFGRNYRIKPKEVFQVKEVKGALIIAINLDKFLSRQKRETENTEF